MSRDTLAESRRLKIIDLLNHAGDGVVSIADLSREMAVSEMTVRRDLDWLEERSILRRVHGGAVASQQAEELDRPFADRSASASLQKQDIGWAAAQLIQDGDRIILDAGTTTQQIARHIGCRMSLVVITNNLPAAVELAACPQIQTILLGGILKQKELCTIGAAVKHELSLLTADKLFLSAAGFSLKMGATDPDFAEAEVKQAMIGAAREVILTLDSSKYNLTALLQVAPLAKIQKLVTDNDLPLHAIRAIEAEGVQVITSQRLVHPVSSSSL
jgi:DeoR/GlpR family transcriptional regulator of sugar metabolism